MENRMVQDRIVRVVLEAYGRGVEWTLDDGETIADCPIVATLAEWVASWPRHGMHVYRCNAYDASGQAVPVQLP